MSDPRSERPRWEKALLALRYAVDLPADMQDLAVSLIREHVAVLATERDRWKYLAEALVAANPGLTAEEFKAKYIAPGADS